MKPLWWVVWVLVSVPAGAVIPHAIFVPLLYGIPTGVVFAVIHKAFERRFAAGG